MRKLQHAMHWYGLDLIDHLLAPGPDAASIATMRSRPPVWRKPDTPLYDKVLADPEERNGGEDASCVLEHIEQFCFFVDFCNVNSSGYCVEKPFHFL